VAEKGVADLSAAASSLGDRARVVWVGPDDEAKADQITAPVAGVELVGERGDMPAVYSAFDVFVLASHREGFSRSAMEAAACGRPMVLTDIRGCREIGEHGRHLLLVPPRDAAALGMALGSLVDDPAQRDLLGAAAAARARASFDQRAVARRSLATYQEVLARHRG
jgi:glycosyltransferase involved in cell wall biosynthesis